MKACSGTLPAGKCCQLKRCFMALGEINASGAMNVKKQTALSQAQCFTHRDGGQGAGMSDQMVWTDAALVRVSEAMHRFHKLVASACLKASLLKHDRRQYLVEVSQRNRALAPAEGELAIFRRSACSTSATCWMPSPVRSLCRAKTSGWKLCAAEHPHQLASNMSRVTFEQSMVI